jgi:hypothetical protein
MSVLVLLTLSFMAVIRCSTGLLGLLTSSFMAVIRCSTGFLGLLTSSFMAVIRCSTGLLVHFVPPVLSRDQNSARRAATKLPNEKETILISRTVACFSIEGPILRVKLVETNTSILLDKKRHY